MKSIWDKGVASASSLVCISHFDLEVVAAVPRLIPESCKSIHADPRAVAPAYTRPVLAPMARHSLAAEVSWWIFILAAADYIQRKCSCTRASTALRQDEWARRQGRLGGPPCGQLTLSRSRPARREGLQPA